MVVTEKYNKLKEIIKEMESIVVAFSGGVDSTFLLKAVVDVLGPSKVLAVTADSESYPSSELAEAKELVQRIGVPHQIIEVSELAIPGYKENTKNRCYFCKQGLFQHLQPILEEKGFKNIVYGLIADDLSEYRPGTIAAKEYGVKAPLQEAGFYKDEIRELSKEMGLITWDKPSYACLSSRIAYGEEITVEKLTKVEKSEEFLKHLGFRQIRVRTHNEIARIEVEPVDFERLLKSHGIIASELQSYGYKYVTLDLNGYKSGSMNKILEEQTNR